MSDNRQSFPLTGFVRLSQIIGNTKANPPIYGFIPVSRSTWWHWVKIGFAPAPIKIGPKITAWVVEEIREFALNRLAERTERGPNI